MVGILTAALVALAITIAIAVSLSYQLSEYVNDNRKYYEENNNLKLENGTKDKELSELRAEVDKLCLEQKRYETEAAEYHAQLKEMRKNYDDVKKVHTFEIQNYETTLHDVCEKYDEEIKKQKRYETEITEYRAQLKEICKNYDDVKKAHKLEIHKYQKTLHDTCEKYDEEIKKLKLIAEPRLGLLKVANSNLEAIPYMARIIADYETYGIENMANCLNWGYDQKRLNKVKSIKEIRDDAFQIVEQHKEAEYQLAYLMELYPALQDFLDVDYKQLPIVKLEELSERDPVQDYLSKAEYKSLTVTQRNQLALLMVR